MTNASDPVFIDPYDEGYQWAKAGKVDARLIAMPAEIMAEPLAYSAHDWRRFRLGALQALMEARMKDGLFCRHCRHYRRIQRGPQLWDVDCYLKQVEFPVADYCGRYEPPPLPESGWETGLGTVWDGEFEGPR